MDKIRVMERSMRCFVFGLFGLIPVLGLGLAVQAIITYGRVRREAGDEWNPAGVYLIWGRVLASVGILISGIVMLVILAVIVYQ